VCKLLGCTHQRLANWDIIRPSIQEAQGSGRPNLWSFGDLVAFRVVKRLNDIGIPLKKLSRIALHVQEIQDENEWGERYLFVDLPDTIHEGDASDIPNWIRGRAGGLHVVVDLKSEVDHVRHFLGSTAATQA
jgi:hypothetical protein